MHKVISIGLLLLLLFSGCQKEKVSNRQALTGGNYKDWTRYKQETDGVDMHLDSCFTDDLWRFFEDGRLQVDLKGTNCGWGITGPVLYAQWYFNEAGDSISWYVTNPPLYTYKISSVSEEQFILQRTVELVDSNGQSLGVKNVLDYFKKR